MNENCPNCGWPLRQDDSFEGWRINLRWNLALGPNGERVTLRAPEACLLHVLFRAGGAIVHRDLLVQRLWGADPDPPLTPYNCIAVYAGRARKALGPHGFEIPNEFNVGWGVRKQPVAA